ncbi:MAG: hypothetical protein ACI936_000497 [Paraglaciecola sp.]|jgi:hypothetical protein
MPCDDAFSYKVLFINHVRPDQTNFRYFPAIVIDDEHADLFVKRLLTKRQLVNIYKGEEHVLVGKSCFINCIKYDSLEWRKVNKNIDSITDLANNIAVSDLIQVPTIFPLEDDSYQVLTGHRRFFALIYSKGNHAPSQFKVYDSVPLMQKIKQFQENSSREDLPQHGKLCAFNAAKIEIDALSAANKQLGRRSISVRETVSIMGISMGAYDNYNVLTRYPCVLEAYDNGLQYPFLKTKKIVLQVEHDFKDEHRKTVLNIIDKRAIDQKIETLLLGEKLVSPEPNSLRIKKIKSSNTIQQLLTSNLQSLDMGIHWDIINWKDTKEVSEVMNKVIDFLENHD